MDAVTFGRKNNYMILFKEKSLGAQLITMNILLSLQQEVAIISKCEPPENELVKTLQDRINIILKEIHNES